jgi:uncharacterized membrane protein
MKKRKVSLSKAHDRKNIKLSGVDYLNALDNEALSRGQRVADSLVKTLGSWRFIIIQSLILFVWAILNILAWVEHWDPYPFILLNLFLSLQAAYAAPLIMMSQNRQAERDRLEAHKDYLINKKAEKEICLLIERLEHQSNEIEKIHQLFLAHIHKTLK